MKIRKLFFKDLSGLRFIGMIGIFVYIITYILTVQKTSELSREYLLTAAALKNISISIFFIISSFLLSAHALREYKYTSDFSLSKFYIRRMLRIFPTLIVALLFYFLIHPYIVELLNLTALPEGNAFYVLLSFPRSYQQVTSEIFIYLFFIYGIFVVLQFYFLWGIILKYSKKYFNTISILLVVIGIVFKIFGNTNDFAGYLYLPFYFYEIGIGALTASLVRREATIINTFKTMSGSTIAAIYILGLSALVLTYLFTNSFGLNLFVKLFNCALVGFFIIEQTYSKHSPLKLRNSQFMIQMGNISYSFIMFAPIFSVIVLIAFESIEINLNSGFAILGYPALCFILTWFTSYSFNNIIGGFFNQVRKEYRAI